MPPPNAEEAIMHIQNRALSEEASRLAEAIFAIKRIRDHSTGAERTFTEAERLALDNLPMLAAIAKDGALLRFFIHQHITDDEWEQLRSLLATDTQQHPDTLTQNPQTNSIIAHIVKKYTEFRKSFESWAAHLDPDAVSELTNAIAHIDNPTAFQKALRISETFTNLLEREVGRTVED